MFNQFCSIIERHYATPKFVDTLKDAVPYVTSNEAIVSVYEEWPDLDKLIDNFKMPHSIVAFDAKRECFVVSDVLEGQEGLYTSRAVMHCQSIDMSSEEVLDEVSDEALAQAPDLPSDAVVVTVSKVFAVGRTPSGRINFSGEVGLSFIASKRKGMICGPSEMARRELARLKQTKKELRLELFNFSREETIKAAVRALEVVIYASKRDWRLHNRPKLRRTKRNLPLWEERRWVEL